MGGLERERRLWAESVKDKQRGEIEKEVIDEESAEREKGIKKIIDRK